MATLPVSLLAEERAYPSSDGRPRAETDWHRILMLTLIQTLEAFFETSPRVYVSGNILVFYVPGNRRRHVSPDVLVVKGVEKRRRRNYLIWREGKSLDLVIELTSKTTRKEDLEKKFQLYQNVLRVQEYFLFDPLAEYLKPPFQGYRLRRGRYAAIRPIAGRLPSRVLGLHLERAGEDLRLYNPETNLWLPTPQEVAQAAVEARRQAEAETERLRREVEALRRQLHGER